MDLLSKLGAAIAIGASLGTAWSVVEKALVYKGWFASKGSYVGSVVMCVKHPGNGLLMWSNGDLQCNKCGREKYGNGEEVVRRIH